MSKDDKSDKLVLEVRERTLRIKENKFAKKRFSRHFKTEKSFDEFKDLGYDVGEYPMSVEAFFKIVSKKKKFTSHRKEVVSNAKKLFSDDIESISVGRTTKRDRRVIKSKLIKEGFDLTNMDIKKDPENVKNIIFIKKEVKEIEEEIEDMSDFI